MIRRYSAIVLLFFATACVTAEGNITSKCADGTAPIKEISADGSYYTGAIIQVLLLVQTVQC